MIQTFQQTTEILQLLFDFRWSMPLLCGSCSFSCAAVETFLALPQLQLVEKSSPVFSRLQKTADFRSCSISTSSSSSPVVPQWQIFMVQSVQQTTEFPQLLYVSGGRCPFCAGCASAVLLLGFFRHLGRYGPQGQLQWHVQGWCCW